MKLLSLFFVILFGLFIATPTVVMLIKSNSDLSVVYNVTEEEQNNNEERSIAENHSKILNKHLSFSLGFLEFSKTDISIYYNKSWAPVYFELTSPPPELA